MFTSLVRIVLGMLFGLILVALLVAAAGRWFLYYDADLPNIQELKLFTPETATVIPQAYICGQTVRVVTVPTRQMMTVRDALFAAEGEVDPRSTARRLYDDAVGNATANQNYGTYSLQVSHQLFCDDQRGRLRREVSELRTSVQLERYFTTDQILDIYLNRASFGAGVYGIENASEHYFAKLAAQLSTPEAALLLGIIGDPSEFSPATHPIGALGRRNQVIDTMAKQGSITSQQAQEAKAAPLGTVADNVTAQ